MANIESTINIKATADTSSAERQLDALSASFDKLNGSIGGLSVGESAIADSLNRISTQGSVFDRMNDSMQGVNASVGEVNTGTGAIVANVDNAATSTAGLAKEMGMGVVTSVSMVITGINQLLELLGKVFDVVSELSEVAQEIEQTLFSMSEILGGEISSDIVDFTVAMQDMYGLDGTTMLVNLNSIADAVAKMGLSSEDAVKVTENLGMFAQNLGSLTGDFSKAYSDLATAIQQGRIGRTSSLYKILSKDEVDEMKSLNSEIERFNYIMSKSDRIGGAFDNFLKTENGQIYLLGQQFERLKSNVGAIAKHIYATWAPVLSNILSGLNAILERIMKLFNIGYEAFDFEGISSGWGKATKGIEDKSKKAAKAVEEVKKEVLSFDDVIQLNDDKNNSGDDSTEEDIADLENLLDLTQKQKEAEEETSSWLDKLKEELAELARRAEIGFNKAWEAGQGDKAIQDILANIATIKEKLKEIFTDPAVVEAMKGMVEQWAETAGAIAGSAAVTVANITAGVTGGIAKWLTDDEEYIKEKIIRISNDMEDLGANIEDTALLWADFSTVFNSEQFSTMIEGLIRVPESLFAEATDLGLSIANSIISGFNTIWSENKEGFKDAAKNTFGVIGDTANEVADEIQILGGALNDFYDNDLAPKIERTAEVISGITGAVLDGWNNDIVPVLDGIDERLNRLFNEHLKPLFDEFFELWSHMSEEITILNEKIIGPVVENLITEIMPMIAGALDGLLDIIENVIGGIMDFIKGLVQFIDGVITGDINKALLGLENMFAGVVNTIIGIVEGAINTITGIINGFFSGVNTIASKLGGNTLDIQIPKLEIPRLATGGIVTRSTIANIGEAGNEAVIPLDRIDEFLSKASKGQNSGSQSIIIDMKNTSKEFYTRSEYLAGFKYISECLKAGGVAISMEY